MAKKMKEDRLISPKMHTARRYQISREPAYWAVFVFLFAAGAMLLLFSYVQPSSPLLAAPELNTVFGFKITTVLIVFVILILILLIVLISKRLAERQYKEVLSK